MSSYPPKDVPLPFNQTIFSVVTLSCEHFASAVTSRGLLRNVNVLRSPVPFLIGQLGPAIILAAILRRLLKPLRQPRFVAEMLAGMILGPTLFHLFGKEDFIESVMTNKEKNMMDVLEALGLMTFSFVVGVRTDVSVVKTAGKLPWIVGVLALLLPMTLVFPVVAYFKKSDPLDGFFLYWVGILASSTSFQVTSFLLEDLHLLNSELGRLAMSSALISSIGSWVFSLYNSFFTWAKRMNFKTEDYFKSEIPRLMTILSIVFVLRPFMFWLMRKIPEGRSIKESQFFVMIVMFLTVGFACDSLGYSASFGGMILGLSTPTGPPLGTGVVEKLDFFVSAVLLPAYIVDVGRYINIFNLTMKHCCHGLIIIFLSLVGKIAATMIPSVIFKVPNKDSFTLGLLLGAQGFWDVLFFKLYLRFGIISGEYYTVLTLSAVLIEAIFTPLISYLYDPSKKYSNYRRRTIQQSINDNELRILLCLHEEDQVFSLLNVLRASYPNREKPIGAFVLDLIELTGRYHPLLINHQFHERRSTTLTRTDRIISAFNQYELRSEGTIKHQHYTSITPYTSMHDDICTLALDKSTSILILPFNKNDSSSPIGGLIKNVLDNAPCSIGILVDKKIISHWRSDSQNQTRLNVCVVFVGGPDAREALAYGMRMVANPATKLTVVRLIAEDEFVSDMLETRHDINLIHQLRSTYDDTQRVEYREVVVRDGVETSKVLFSLDEQYDFMLVGRRLDSDSTLVTGLVDWSYAPELGIIGEILASSDMKCSASVLVVQQQALVGDVAHKA